MAGTNGLAPVFSAWLDSAMPNRQGMVLGKVESASCDAQGYRCSMRLLDTETLEETGDQLEDVPINNLQGFWSLPAVDLRPNLLKPNIAKLVRIWRHEKLV